jgi:hypothetical protein
MEEISDQESCSDHSIVRYVIGHSRTQRTDFDIRGVKYKVTKEYKEKFQRNLIRWVELKLCGIKQEKQIHWTKSYTHE